MKTFLKKLEYLSLVEKTKIENATFPYKIALSKATDVKINRTGGTKWPITKNRALPYFIFWFFFFSLRTSYRELIWCKIYLIVHFHTFCKHWIFIWELFFSVSILKKYFSFFNNTPSASWVASYTREFLTWYSCSYYNFTV